MKYTSKMLKDVIKKYFERVWSHFSEKERFLMFKLAEGNMPDSIEFNILNNLKYYGFIEEDNNSFNVSGEAFKDWISSTLPQGSHEKHSIDIDKGHFNQIPPV